MRDIGSLSVRDVGGRLLLCEFVIVYAISTFWDVREGERWRRAISGWIRGGSFCRKDR